MAIVSVSNAAGLRKALDSADRGDQIVLAAGNYGSLSLGKEYKFDDVTITSKSDSNPAVFNMVNLNQVTNLTFDNIKFDYNGNSGTSKPFFFTRTNGVSIVNSKVDGMVKDGYGSGHGLWIKESSDFRVENTDIFNFNKALAASNTDDLKVIDNAFSGLAEDAMQLSRIDGALIEGNSVEMEKGPAGTLHRDMIQFWNAERGDTSRDITIRGNTLEASSGVTHGIYMANETARVTGDLDDFYRNITIENNTVRSGQAFGIVVGEAVGLKISSNTVLQHSAIDSSKGVDIPVILVDKDARTVSITGNTTHKTPVAVEALHNWQPDDYKTSGWTIANNKIVALGASGSSSGSSSGGGSSAPSAPAVGDAGSGDGKASNFLYLGTRIDGAEKVTYGNVDFGEGDRILLRDFDTNTFSQVRGGNEALVNAEKTYARIDSLTDIQELVTASKDLTVSFQTNDTLVLRIAQDDGSLSIALPGFAADYKATCDDKLF